MDNVIQRIQEQCMTDSEAWFPNNARDLTYMTLAMCGETGEFANVVKKVCRGSIELQDALPQLREELTDVFIYLMNLSELLKLDLVNAYIQKREFNLERFGSRDGSS